MTKLNSQTRSNNSISRKMTTSNLECSYKDARLTITTNYFEHRGVKGNYEEHKFNCKKNCADNSCYIDISLKL